MLFIGITAAIDAVIALIAWIVVMSRKGSLTESSKKVNLFSTYLLTTFIFLVAISAAILFFTDVAQLIMIMVADLILWVSLIAFINFMYEGTNWGGKRVAIIALLVFAASRTLFQIAGIIGVSLEGFAPFILYVLSNLDAWLMYVVWLPAAFALIGVALSAESAVVRARSLMVAIGLILITFTWAFRILGQGILSGDPALLLVSGASVVGFALLLFGVVYRGKGSAAQTQPEAS